MATYQKPALKEFALDSRLLSDEERRKMFEILKEHGVPIHEATDAEYDADYPYLCWSDTFLTECRYVSDSDIVFERADVFLALFGIEWPKYIFKKD